MSDTNDKNQPCSVEKVEVLLQALERVQDERWNGHRREHEMMASALDLEKKFISEKLEALNELRREVIEDRSQFIAKNIYETVRAEQDRRISLIENGKLGVADAEKIEQAVRELQQKGCDQARQALNEAHELQTKFSKLELASASRGAVEDTRQELLRYRSKQAWLVAGNIIALCGVVTAVFFGILAYLKQAGH